MKISVDEMRRTAAHLIPYCSREELNTGQVDPDRAHVKYRHAQGQEFKALREQHRTVLVREAPDRPGGSVTTDAPWTLSVEDAGAILSPNRVTT